MLVVINFAVDKPLKLVDMAQSRIEESKTIGRKRGASSTLILTMHDISFLGLIKVF
jgi:hypothetical protein